MNRRWLISLTLVALSAAPASSAITVEGDDAGVRLSLGAAQRGALENNLDLVIARKDPRIAEHRIAIEQGAFDPTLTSTASYADSDADSETTESFAPPGTPPSPTSRKSKSTRFEVALQQRLTFGAQYTAALTRSTSDFSRVGFGSSGFFGGTDSNSTEFSPNIAFDLPLLRGFGKESNTASLVLARSGLDTSHDQLELSALRTLKDVEDAYWDLIAAREALSVARESLKLAKDLLDLNRKKVEVGTLAPIEITQAEAGVASREEGVILAEAGVEGAEDRLRRLLGYPAEDPIWRARIVPTDAPDFQPRTVKLDDAIATALARRPEIAVARRQVSDRELSERVAKSDSRHGLDFNATLGRPDTKNEFVSVNQISPTTFVQAGGQEEGDGLDWTVRLLYGYPIGNRAAKARTGIAVVERERAEVSLRSVEQDVRVDVRSAVRNVESGAKRVSAARASTVLQRKKLEAEQKKFDNGMSTSFEVLTFQTDLQNAQLSEIRALLDYQKALADLERAQGTLLEARGLNLETDR